MDDKRILIIAGPNGAGKTTFAEEFLPNEADCANFINADMIAANLFSIDPKSAAYKAGKIMLETMTRHVANNESFVFETTLSGKAYLKRIKYWQSMGYTVSLVYLSLSNVQQAIDRVAERVKQGGHDIPQTTIERRYSRSWENFRNYYSNLVDDWAHYDNSGSFPVLLKRVPENAKG